jgi:hypothetical protein
MLNVDVPALEESIFYWCGKNDFFPLLNRAWALEALIILEKYIAD